MTFARTARVLIVDDSANCPVGQASAVAPAAAAPLDRIAGAVLANCRAAGVAVI